MDRRVDEILRVLESNELYIRLPRSLDDLAEGIHISGSRLRHLFRAETGGSPSQFLRVLRLNRAKQLLETSHLSVKEVMAEIGMSNESSFVRTFRKAYGVTPGSIRLTRLPRHPDPQPTDPQPKSAKTASMAHK